jgi:hypothetical protein
MKLGLFICLSLACLLQGLAQASDVYNSNVLKAAGRKSAAVNPNQGISGPRSLKDEGGKDEEENSYTDVWGPRFLLASIVLIIFAYLYLEYKAGRLGANRGKKEVGRSSENNINEGLLDDTLSEDSPKKSTKDMCVDAMKRLYLCLDVVILLLNTISAIKSQGRLAASYTLGDDNMYSGENMFTAVSWYIGPKNYPDFTDRVCGNPDGKKITVWTAGIQSCDRGLVSIVSTCNFEREPVYVVAYGTWMIFLLVLLFRKVYQSLHYETNDFRFYLSADHFAKSKEMKYATYFGYILTLANVGALIHFADKDGRGFSNYLSILTFAGINCYAFYSSAWSRWPILTAESKFHALFPQKIAVKPCVPAATNLYGVLIGCEKLYKQMIMAMNQSDDALAKFGNPSKLRDLIAKLYQEPSIEQKPLE